jgi:hypothetical protein
MAPPHPIVWLASYPKSGNTWLRFLLYHYLYGEITASADVERRIPDLHATGPDKLPQPDPAIAGGALLCKTHMVLGAHHPHLDRTAGFVYIARHPRDVLISDLNYVRMTAPDSDQFSDELYVSEFIRHMGSPAWQRLGVGTWPGHFASWLAGAARFPHVLIRYEAMKKDPVGPLERVLRLLGEDPDPARVAAAVEASSFERMRDLESRERAAGTPSAVFSINQTSLKRDRRFMREGATRQSLEPLGEDLARAFDERFREALGFLGYADG